MSTPSGSVTFSDDNSESSTLTAALLIGVGLQMDEAVAINDEASIILAFTATEQYSDCPALTVQVVDAVTVNLRFFSISISPELYSFPVYAGQPVGIATDQTCAPTAAPTASVYPHYSFIFLDTSTSCTDCYDIWGQYLCPDGLWCYQPCTAECTPDDDYYAQQRTPHSWVQIPGGSTVYINGIGEYWYNMALYGACWSQYSPYDCVLYFAMDEAFTYGPGYEVETVTNNVLTTAASCNTDVYPGFSHCWQKSYYPAITDDAYYEYIPPTPWPPAESQSTSSPGKLLRGPVI